MKGAMLRVNPAARITDIAHELRAQDTLGAAFVLKGACPYFPTGTIHVAVIDPGVGSGRAGVIIETARYIFVGPDNGIFTLALEDEEIVRLIHITNKDYYPGPVSRTFHGRDIFAPVAAHLSLGALPSLMGEEIDKLVELSLPKPLVDKASIKGEVIHIDGYGNLISNIRNEELKGHGKKKIIEIRGKTIGGIIESYSYSEGASALCAIIGSTGLLEIALNMGSAKESLKAEIGDKITVSL
jgi:S-adenosylmethionine hydrolase